MVITHHTVPISSRHLMFCEDSSKESQIPMEAAFIAIGHDPNTRLFKGQAWQSRFVISFVLMPTSRFNTTSSLFWICVETAKWRVKCHVFSKEATKQPLVHDLPQASQMFDGTSQLEDSLVWSSDLPWPACNVYLYNVYYSVHVLFDIVCLSL